MTEEYSNKDKGMPWHAWGCMTIAFLIPFAKKFVPGFIALLGIYAVVFALRKRKWQVLPIQWPHLLLALLFFLLIIGIGYSDHRSDAINEIGIKLSFIAFPLLGFLIPPLSPKDYNNILKAFVLGSLSFIPLAIGYGVYRSIEFQDYSYLTYQNLGIYLHPTYAATYESLSVFILLRNAAKGDFLFRKKSLHYLLIGISILFISMLASKAGLLAGIISIAFGGYVLLKRKISIREPLVVIALSLIVLFGSAFLLPGVSSRVESAVQDVENNEPISTDAIGSHAEAKSSTQLRYVTWKYSYELLKENPMGVGTGDTQFELIKKYDVADEHYAAQKKLNAHNQFLQTGAELGWPGLLILISLLTLLSVLSWKWQDLLLMEFLALCVMNFLFESFLEVQAGIVFFCFWILVFVKRTKKKSVTTNLSKEHI